MGNTGSCEGPYADIELTAQEQPLVAIGQRFMKSEVTRLRLMETSSYSKNLEFENVLLDADKMPIVHIATKKNIKRIYYVYRSENTPATENEEAEKDSELLQIYVKQGLAIKKGYLDTQMRTDFTDLTTGERCKIEIEGEWCSRNAVLWLQQGFGDSSRTRVGKIYRPAKGMYGDVFHLDIAPNVDTALVVLICAIVDEDMKILRRRENRHGVVVYDTVE